jgi:predicted transcriptional regulator YdeE
VSAQAPQFTCLRIPRRRYAVFVHHHIADIRRTWDASWNGWLPGSGHEVARLKALDVKLLDDRVIGEGPLKLFRFADPDGNVLELFSL